MQRPGTAPTSAAAGSAAPGATLTAAAPGAAKKFIVKPFKPAAGLDHAKAVEVFTKLQQAIKQIHDSNASQLSFEELYRFAYNLVLYKHGELLYEGVTATVKHHLTKKAEAARVAPDEVLLERLREVWERHTTDMRMVRDILMYMDRTFVPSQRKLLIYDQGTYVFREVVARHPDIRPRLQRLLLAAMADARAGRQIDAQLIRSVLAMLVDLGINSTSVYQEDFEAGFLAVTSQFYHDESADFLARNTCPDYLRKAEDRLHEERSRADMVLNPTTVPKLMGILERCLIADHAVQVVEMEGSGLVWLLEHDRLDDLNRMYRLFSLVKTAVPYKQSAAATAAAAGGTGGPAPILPAERTLTPAAIMRDTLKTHVLGRGRAVLADEELGKDPVAFVQALLDLRDKHARVVNEAFNSDKEFHRALKEAFELFMNGDARCPEYLSIFVDEQMKHGFKGASEADVDDRLNKVVILFRFLHDKDVFEEYYKFHLQKRLLAGKSASDDAEKAMIAKLKTECGFQFTSKLEGMFNDLRVSSEFMVKYRGDRGPLPAAAPDLDVTVLTTGFWPSMAVPPCRLPADVAAAADHFKTYYLSKHNGRKLVWQTSKGSADIRAVFGGRRHELNVSTYQMAILMLFNDAETVTYPRLAAELGIPEDELKRHLLSLTAPKARVLNRSKKSREIESDETFSVNNEFTSKLVKIKIPLISLKSVSGGAGGGSAGAAGGGGTGGSGGAASGPGGLPREPTEGPDVPELVEESRKHLMEAAIVRIMKTRRTLDHANLVSEVTRQLAARFRPSPQDIKKRIESLMEREYLERDKDDKKTYHYLA